MLMENESDEFNDNPPKWTVVQLALAVFCTMSLSAFVKVQEAFYFGSGWALMGFVLFILIIGWPILYTQIRLGNQYQRGILGLFRKFFPLSFGFGVAMIVRNILSIIYVSSVMTHCLSYMFFSVYPCNKRYCVGATYMWGSCEDEWNRKVECRLTLAKTQQGPTPEEGFYLYFNMDVAGSIFEQWFPRWFQLDALNTVPHIVNWVLIFLTVFWGPRAFGWLLYGLAPLSLALMLVPFGVILANCPDYKQLDEFWQRFYRNFAATIPLNKLAVDTYRFEPVIWGLLSLCVHLASSLHLWHGVWPSVGSWVKRGRKTMHLAFLPVLLVFSLLIHLPTLLAVVCYASAFDMDYLRCHVAHSYALPFTLIPHVLSKFALHPAVAVCYFAGLYLSLLLAQSLLLVASADGITDYLRHRHRTVEEQRVRTYRLLAGLACPVMFALSFPCILRSGYWWLRLYDRYMDRLMLLIVGGAGVGFFIASYRVRNTFLIARLMHLITLGLGVTCFLGIYCWYASAATAEPAISGCFYEPTGTTVIFPPIPSAFFDAIGWLLAASPIVIGLAAGLASMACSGGGVGEGGGGYGRFLVYGDFLPGEVQLASQRKQQEFQLRSTLTGARSGGGASAGLLASRGGDSSTSATLQLRSAAMSDY